MSKNNNNMFAKFAATSKASSKLAKSKQSSGGWLTTKRRGRDDDTIAQDRDRALQARKTARSKKNTSTKTAPPKKKKKNAWSDEEDDDDEINSFVVDDDEELEEDWNSDDDDDDEVVDDLDKDLVIAEPRRRAAKLSNNKNNKKPKWNRNENDSDDDEFIDTPRADRKADRKSTPITVDSEEDEAEFVDEDSEDEEDVVLLDDDESDNEITPVKSKFFPKRKRVTDDDSSSDDSCAGVGNVRSRNNAARTTLLQQKKEKKEPPVDKSKNKRLKKKKPAAPILSDDSDDEGMFSPMNKTKTATSALVSSTESNGSSTALFKDDDDELTPVPKERRAKAKNDVDQAALSENDDNTPEPPRKRKRKMVEEDDENMAVALALSASQAEFEAASPVTKQYREDSDEERPPEEDEEDDEDDASHVNETHDERRDAASRVLESANKLSQQVLQNMMAWSSEGGASASQGMIVDGALALMNCDESSDDTRRKAWISQAQMKEICPKVVLAGYQLIGVNWLALLHEMRVDVGDTEKTNVNGILADVMGLGKTVQTIAFLAWLHAKNGTGKDADDEDEVVNICDSDDERENSTKSKYKPVHVVVVPASVLDNWMDEFEKFAPQLSVVKYHGPMAKRNEMRFDLERRLPRKKNPKKVKGDIDVVLTTFSYFSGNKSDDRKFLRRFDFEYMVIDEAHCLKNPDSNAYQNLDRFDTAHRLLLTGTPVQNSPKELMSLICFLMPLFKNAGSTGWDDDENKNDGGARMLEHFVSLEGGAGDAMSDEAAYRKLKQLFAPFVLRRGKDVLSQTMPKKTREVLRVPLNPSIRKLYNEILSTHLRGKENKKAIGGNQAARQHLFTTLRKVANHPLLLRNRYSSASDIEHLASHLRMYGYFGHDDACTLGLVKKELETFSDFDIHIAALDVIDENPIRQDAMSRYVLAEEDMFCSPKLEKLRTLIPDLVNKGHRLLIFSQWTNCLDLLGCLMESLKYKFFRLDGQTAISSRQDMINDFNNDPSVPVFLLSTKAGGMGINLTAADVCILHDLDFNPFNDLQAEDRCHRIGQTKPVRVIKMVTMETVDDDIYSMQQRKTSMNAAILERGGSSLDSAAEKKKDQEEIKSMLQNQLDRYLSSETTKLNSGGMMQFLKKK